MRSGNGWSRSLGLAVAVAIVLSTVPAVGTDASQDAVTLTDEAAKLIQDGRLVEALERLEQAVAEDSDYWEAHYQRGRALGQLERYEEARDALLRAAELNPGHGHTHGLAALAARRIEDWETAWDQAIRASLAGENMNRLFLEMYQVSTPPDDFEHRIRAPRVFVGAPEADQIASEAELPFNTNPQSGGIGSITGRPASAMGRERLKENISDLVRVQRIFRETLSSSRYFGVVLEPADADYIIGISIDEIGESAPVQVEGYLRLYDPATGDAVYYRTLEFRDITQEAIVHGEVGRYVADMASWFLDQSRKQ